MTFVTVAHRFPLTEDLLLLACWYECKKRKVTELCGLPSRAKKEVEKVVQRKSNNKTNEFKKAEKKMGGRSKEDGEAEAHVTEEKDKW